MLLLKRLMGNYTRQPWPQETVDLYRDRLTYWCKSFGYTRVSSAVDSCINDQPELRGIADIRSRIPELPERRDWAITPPPGETMESMRENYREFARIFVEAAKKSRVIVQ